MLHDYRLEHNLQFCFTKKYGTQVETETFQGVQNAAECGNSQKTMKIYYLPGLDRPRKMTSFFRILQKHDAKKKWENFLTSNRTNLVEDSSMTNL